MTNKSEWEVAAEMCNHYPGETGRGLSLLMESSGMNRRIAQRAIQAALDRGAIVLGHNLELLPAEPKQ